jgi:hemolysin activation/secretion protein
MRPFRPESLRSLARWALLALLVCQPAWAQQGVPRLQPPVREEPALPALPPPEAPPPAEILTPLPEPPAPDPGRLSTGLQVYVREFRILGNTVFSEADLAEVVAPYTNRRITSQDLEAARQALTLYYVERGYVNSGAVIPDQETSSGVIELRVIEGRLSDVQIEGTRWFRADHLRSRLLLGADEPLEVAELEQRLQLLQQDERIRRLNAELGPGGVPGEAILRVRVEEELPIRAELDFGNDESPAIGELQGRVALAHENLIGRGDVLSTTYSVTGGLHDVDTRYEIPVNPWDTRLELQYWWSSSEVTEDSFEDLDIESRAETAGIGLSHPLIRTPNTELRAGLTGEWRRSRVRLGGSGFPFPGTGADDDGESRVSVLRIHQQWVYRDRSQVLAARSVVSVGLDVLNATQHSGEIVDGQFVDLPDGQFVSWLAQLRWARRFDELFGTEVVFRTDLQLSNHPLMPLEQFPIGGPASVRGYREDEIAMDQGVASSLEVRVPLVHTTSGHLLQLAPFVDVGHGWNESRPSPWPQTLIGAGVGLRYSFGDWIRAELYWGEQLKDLPEPQDRSLQDRGIHFRISAQLL